MKNEKAVERLPDEKSDAGLPVVVEQPLPIVMAEDAKKAMEAYQRLCAAVLIPWEKRIVKDGVVKQESDYQRIRARVRDPETGKDEPVLRDFPKKSAWRKLGRFYSVSTEILEKERVERDDDSFVWHYTVKAIAPNGQFTSGEGSCDSREVHGDRRREHDTKATAHTRAKNRAISDLIGFGQVSAEEIIPPPKHVDSEVKVVEPDKKTQLRLGRVDVDVILYNLRATGVSDDVDVSEQDDGFYISPKRTLGDEDYNRINETLVPMGAEWLDDQRWVIWKEAEC